MMIPEEEWRIPEDTANGDLWRTFGELAFSYGIFL
jgi:hypothetical protein